MKFDTSGEAHEFIENIFARVGARNQAILGRAALFLALGESVPVEFKPKDAKGVTLNDEQVVGDDLRDVVRAALNHRAGHTLDEGGYGFEFADESKRKMSLVCSIYLDLPNPFQAQLFATINYNQKPVDKSQSYQLYGFNLDQEPSLAWSPEKAAVFMSRKLNTEANSPFEDHITIAAEDQRVLDQLAPVKKMGWAISTATIVEGVLRLFSSNPKRDRDIMHTKEVGKGRSRQQLQEIRDPSPLRRIYIDGNDLLVFTLVRNYFAACADLFWNKKPDIGYIRKTVGVQALFEILRKISPEIIASKDLSKEYLKKRLQPAAVIPFQDDFFQASGTGRQRIRNCIELCLALRQLNEIEPESERPSYRRLCDLPMVVHPVLNVPAPPRPPQAI
jgi:DNA phosphorothioation-associated DGQHR protein 1